MIGTRLVLAQEAGLDLPAHALVLQPPMGADLSALPGVRVVHPLRPVHDDHAARGHEVTPEAAGQAPLVVICLPRAKREAQQMIATAAALTDGALVIDGQKTDGIDSVLKAVKARVPVDGVISKAHGKLFWINDPAPEAFADWQAGPERTEGGFWTAPGVFSADGIDPGSALLAEALPEDLQGQVGDLGAGWGFLSAHVLVREGVEALHLVEAHHMALQCAEHNVTDPRARFHWADATTWEPPALLDAVVMNPPFHTGRNGDPGLGKGFITAAAKMLKPSGKLWMVANRHLPYEETLAERFTKIIDLGGDARFKLTYAERPKRRR